MQNGLSRAGGGDMSWARAIILATGFFFISAIYLGQIPAFFGLAYTQAQLHTASQATLTLGLLALGIALIALTASFLYDPKPLTRLFPPLFGLVGLGLAGVGSLGMLFVLVTGHHYFPDQTISQAPGGGTITTNWPDPSHGWFLSPTWFQPQSVDIGAISFVAFITGMGILTYVALYFPYSRGKLTPAVTALITRLFVGIAAALMLAYLTIYTFSASATTKSAAGGAIENIVLVLALGMVLFALQVWLLQVMTAPGNRQRFMPSLYLHAVQLIASVAVPLLVIFVVLYPVVNWMNSVNLSDGYWVECAIKTDIPDSCTFTPYIGYIIEGIVSGMFFTFLIAAGYLWNRKPAFVKLGMTFAFVFAALAVIATHDSNPANLPVALVLGIGIAILGTIWTITTQREFVLAAARNVTLGCTGQWLVMGTLLFIYLAGFGLFSYPQFFDTEQNLIIQQGGTALHDAYWVILIAGGLAAMQFAFLTRRDALGNIRKLALWLVLIGAGMEIAASVHFNPGAGIDLSNGGNPVNFAYYFGILIELLGILVGWYGALSTRGFGLLVTSFATTFAGAALAIFFAVLPTPHYDVMVAFTVLAGLGTILYAIYGKDAPDPQLARFMGRASAPHTTTATPATTEPGLPE
jgi:hypothetical protein